MGGTAHAPASEPTNRHVVPESRKHPQERSITDRSGQQYPGEIAAGGESLGRAKDIMQENNEEGYVKELVYLDTPIICTPEELMEV